MLDKKFEEVGLDLGPYMDQLMAYKDLVLEWNKKFNLTAIKEEEEFHVKHLYDCLLLLKLDEIKEAKTIVDVGTGAGFPGMVLAITEPEKKITLVDSVNKKVRFLDIVVEELGLKNVRTIHGRSEELARDKAYRDSFDLCTSRAVASLDTLCEYCLPLVKPGGYLVAMKGSKASEELDQADQAIKLLSARVKDKIDYTLTEDDHERSLIIIEKINPTDKKYPRAGGAPRSKPL